MENHMLLHPLAIDSDAGAKKNETQTQQLHLPQYSPQPSTDPSLYNQKLSPLPPPSHPPPSYNQSHDAASLSFPNVPTTELAPIHIRNPSRNERTDNTLPSLASLTGQQTQAYTPPQPREPTYSPPPPPRVNHWPSLNPLTAYYAPSHVQSADSPGRMDVDVNASGAVNAASPDRFYEGRASSVSLDDPDVRMAAEALGDLRADFVSSPPKRNTPLSTASPPTGLESKNPADPEPLFALLTTSHPLLATTIEGATSAYNTSKNFSPRFKTGAEYVEGYLTPIANTVGNVGRVTGVEGGVRWFLGASRRHQSSSSDIEADAGSHKRRKFGGSSESALEAASDRTVTGPQNDADPFAFTRERRASMSTVDTLPAYDEFRSPAYSEAVDTPTASRPSSSASAWQSRLIMSTSGLSIAMSEESLRSLKYCLSWLRWANDHIGNVVNTLKSTLDQYDSGTTTSDTAESSENSSQDQPIANAESSTSHPENSEQTRNELAARIADLRSDVLKTLRDVIDTVSKYAGGALPENARVLVRKHLTSLPQRFRLAHQIDSSASQQGEMGPDEKEKEMREGAQRVMVLAKEGLDMMAQVSGVLDGTIVSAEEWCERLGKKKKEERENLLAASALTPSPVEPMTGVGIDGDVKMGDSVS